MDDILRHVHPMTKPLSLFIANRVQTITIHTPTVFLHDVCSTKSIGYIGSYRKLRALFVEFSYYLRTAILDRMSESHATEIYIYQAEIMTMTRTCESIAGVNYSIDNRFVWSELMLMKCKPLRVLDMCTHSVPRIVALRRHAATLECLRLRFSFCQLEAYLTELMAVPFARLQLLQVMVVDTNTDIRCPTCVAKTLNVEAVKAIVAARVFANAENVHCVLDLVGPCPNIFIHVVSFPLVFAPPGMAPTEEFKDFSQKFSLLS